MGRALLASAGTVILDKDGTPFATVTRDIHRGATARPSDFMFADGHVAVFGEMIPTPILDYLYGRTFRP